MTTKGGEPGWKRVQRSLAGISRLKKKKGRLVRKKEGGRKKKQDGGKRGGSAQSRLEVMPKPGLWGTPGKGRGSGEG